MNTEITIKSGLSNTKPLAQNEELEIQLHEILIECMGQVELLNELVRLFKRNMLEFIGSVKVNLINEDVESIGFASHKIKSGLRMMRIDSLLEITEQISAVCKTDKDIKHITFLYNQFVDEYPAVEEALDAEMK